MGVGNFYLTNAHTVYVDHEHIYDEVESDDFDAQPWQYDDLISNIKSVLPTTFVDNSKYVTEYQDECLVLAESGLFVVTVRDWQGYVAVNIAIKDSISEGPTLGLANHHHWPTARKIFDALAELYPLRVRCCAWTSGEYIVEKKHVA